MRFVGTPCDCVSTSITSRRIFRPRLAQVLRSAMGHYNNGRLLTKGRAKLFWTAYRYLRKQGLWMHYPAYRRQGMPIGSGVKEAACKTVFAERLKRKGMTWSFVGG